MSKYFYWNSYEKPFKFTFWILVTLFSLLAISIIGIQIFGTDSLIPWNVLTQDSSFLSDFKLFTKGPFNFSIPAEKIVLKEVFSGGAIPQALIATKILMVTILAGMLVYLVLVTLFKRIWYLMAMGGMLAFLVLMNIESVALFGWTDIKGLVIVFIFLLTPSYYLHAFAKSANFMRRLWIMGLSMLTLLGLIYFFGESTYGLSSLFGYGLLAPYILIILFIITVSHEILAAFVNLISGSSGIGDSTKMRHFLIITLIYLANILLSFLYIAHYIDWQLIYINPFVLLIISAVLGIWGSRSRASLYVSAPSLEALWPILYLIISVISMGTLTYLMLSVNDPMLKVLADISIYAHLGIGFAFLFYIIYNFIPLIEKGYDLQPILYNPKNLPYLTFRLMGLIIVVGLFAVRGFEYPSWYSIGGYNNANADIEQSRGNTEVAEAYYSLSNVYAYHNHKANYTLGRALEKEKPSEALKHYKWAMDQAPTAQTIINKANLENSQMEYYKALFTLQEGNKAIEDNAQIQNNLARQFERVRIADSAAYYYGLAGYGVSEVINNRLAFSAEMAKPLGKDSTSILNNLDRVGRANAAALGYIEKTPDISSGNHMYDMALLNNWLLADGSKHDAESLAKAKMAIDSTFNAEYHDKLIYSWAMASSRHGEVTKAIEGLSGLMYASSDWADRAKNALGRIYLDLGSYEQAINLLSEVTRGEISLEIAVAHLELGIPEKVEDYWLMVSNYEDEYISELAKEILAAIYSENPDLNNDRIRYLYSRYNKYLIDESEHIMILNSIADENLKVNLALELARFYHENANDAGASLMLKNIEGLGLSLSVYKEYIVLDALIHPQEENVQHQIVEYDSLFGFSDHDYLLESWLNHKAGMALDSLDYIRMATDNPFFTDAVLTGVGFFKNFPDSYDAYNYLAKAVQMNPESPRLLNEYILLALDMGMDQFAENALAEFGQRFSGQAYLVLKNEYEKKKELINASIDSEPIQ